jgi:ferredoxin
MYVKVIDAKCCGYTVCADACPEVYKLDDQGFAFVESDLVPPELEEKAAQGAKACPEAAIVLSETPFE